MAGEGRGGGQCVGGGSEVGGGGRSDVSGGQRSVGQRSEGGGSGGQWGAGVGGQRGAVRVEVRGQYGERWSVGRRSVGPEFSWCSGIGDAHNSAVANSAMY